MWFDLVFKTCTSSMSSLIRLSKQLAKSVENRLISLSNQSAVIKQSVILENYKSWKCVDGLLKKKWRVYKRLEVSPAGICVWCLRQNTRRKNISSRHQEIFAWLLCFVEIVVLSCVFLGQEISRTVFSSPSIEFEVFAQATSFREQLFRLAQRTNVWADVLCFPRCLIDGAHNWDNYLQNFAPPAAGITQSRLPVYVQVF